MGSGVNWDSYGAAQLKGDIEGGAGTASANTASATWSSLASMLRDMDVEVRLGLAKSGATWQGQGADAAKAAVTPFTEWAQQADKLAVQTKQSTTSAAEFFSSAKNSMPDQITTVSEDNFFESAASFLPGVTTDQEKTEAAAAAENTQAREAMKTYDASAYSDATRTWFSDPPAITVASTPPAPATPTDPGTGGSGTPGAPGSYPKGGTDSTAQQHNVARDPQPVADAGTGGRPVPWSPLEVPASPAGMPTGATPAGAAPTGPYGSSGYPITPAAVSSAGWSAPASAGSVGAGGLGTGSTSTGGYGAGGFGGVAGFGGGSGGSAGGSAGGYGSGGSGPAGGAGTRAGAGAGGTAGTGGTATGARGGGAMGGAGPGRGGQGAEDEEHVTPDYLKVFEHFSDGRLVSPPVIGE